MESRCRTRAPGPAPCPARSLALLLLLLLLLPRPVGCAGAAATPETLGRPRLPRQAWTSPTSQPTPTPVPTTQPEPPPACGFSSEKNPTLWDPEAMVRRWPWMVSVQANGTHLCAGTLIASHWVLTAAHCLTRDDINYTVRVGSPWINQTSQVSADVPVLQVILNSKFQPQRYWSWVSQANNIGLLELQPGLNYSKYVQPACLPGLNYTVEDGAVCIVTGWGLSQVDGTWPQFQTIQEKEVTVLKRQECEDFYHRFLHVPSLVQTISPEMMCVTDPSRGKFCCELSGEPLVCSPKSKDIWYLVGLVTWGPGCQEGKAPPIFLRVSSYTPWILDRLNQQPPALPAPSRVLLLALPLSLSLLAAL